MRQVKALYILSILIFVFSERNFAQDSKTPEKQTVLNSKMKVSFATQLRFSVGALDKSAGVFINPSIGILVDDRFFAGLGGNVLLNNKYIMDASYKPVKDETAYWTMKYGGLQLQYNFNPVRSVNFSLGTLAGFGEVKREFNCNSLTDQSPEYANFNEALGNTGYYFVMEPSAIVGLNLTKNITLKADASYRFIFLHSHQNIPGITNGKFSKPSVGIGVMISGFPKGL